MLTADVFSYDSGVMCWLIVLVHFIMSTGDGIFPVGLQQLRDYFGINYVLGGILGSVYYIGIAITPPFLLYLANF